MRPRNVLAIAFALALAVGLSVVQPALAIAPPDEESELIDTQEAYADVRVQDPHDPTRAMHPVRVAAYALHPVGVALDWVLVRPAVWFVRREPFRTIFGYQD